MVEMKCGRKKSRPRPLIASTRMLEVSSIIDRLCDGRADVAPGLNHGITETRGNVDVLDVADDENLVKRRGTRTIARKEYMSLESSRVDLSRGEGRCIRLPLPNSRAGKRLCVSCSCSAGFLSVLERCNQHTLPPHSRLGRRNRNPGSPEMAPAHIPAPCTLPRSAFKLPSRGSNALPPSLRSFLLLFSESPAASRSFIRNSR
ncbi:hypothetical protein MPTK1_3g08180 [Marchantia polymorpha subsp. ruderalis]|uniref:Uncharacterized protein n=2 Tax=Marchantia polymorpha TaxID=3197 RepID=A0AAF6AYL6_MARPO|nr:hypothetical protein MARPO_0006s0292 [Marchantia polymorpha]BBN04850.1 hypothetical protein Mp_3g08180 [Marchantia polymorpha subsp. ruderalis]|eukprot:PTQ48301.1 hypothetical protein MARPO_0006s0292 [Marchantia polymorpha]